MTCLCLTKNRRQWLPKAIQCFKSQTYPNKELLIIADGEDVRDLVSENENVRLIHIEEDRVIGDKRNFGASRSGEIIAHFDDDDYSAPGRLADEVERLLFSEKAVTGYCSMRFTDGIGWWEYRSQPNFALGTSLLYRKEWWKAHPFPAKQVGEDGDFVNEAIRHQQIVSVESGELMHASIHPGNTSPRCLRGDNWKKL